MAKAAAKTGRTAVRRKKETKKSGKTKWVILVLVLLILLLLLVYLFGWTDTFNSFFNEAEPIEEPAGKIEVVMDNNQQGLEDLDQMIQVDQPEEIKEEPAPAVQKQLKPRSNRYYIKVEDCMVMSCQQEVIRFLRQEKLPVIKRKYTRKTKYFELVSSSVYTRQTGNAKIQLLKKQPEVVAEPYLVSENKRFRISMGLFPQQETGVKMRSDLALLYPKVKIDFNLRPIDRRYTVTTIYSGPFQKGAASQILEKLHSFPEYESSVISWNI